MTNSTSANGLLLNEENNFYAYENILYVTATPYGSNCIFGQNDYVSSFGT